MFKGIIIFLLVQKYKVDALSNPAQTSPPTGWIQIHLLFDEGGSENHWPTPPWKHTLEFEKLGCNFRDLEHAFSLQCLRVLENQRREDRNEGDFDLSPMGMRHRGTTSFGEVEVALHQGRGKQRSK